MTKKPYRKTILASFIGFVSQSIIVNFAPLLFLTFQSTYSIPIEEITLLVMVNFITQLITDLLASKYAKKIGYRFCLVISHILCGAGLIIMTVLPEMMDPFAALIISTSIYAVGGGLLEVLLNPVLDACPIENKSGIMSLMHSFYCWGVVGVVILSTAFFSIFGIHNWKILSCLWAVIPLMNAVFLTRVPIYPIAEETKDRANYKELFSQRVFWVIMIIMICSGAAEITVSQWASTFVEKEFSLPKTTGDLIGVCGFSLFMGIARLLYAKQSEKIHIKSAMIVSALLCIISYLIIGLSDTSVSGLIGCILCGLSVGVFWPGTISMASERVKAGGTTMFALCALSGDLGCTTGPALAGFMTGVMGGNMRLGILCSVVFPILMLIGLVLLKRE